MSSPMTGRSSGSASARAQATRCAQRRGRAKSWCASSPTAACTKMKWTWSPRILPGRETREVWTLAHLYEPMSNDNSTGVIAGIEIARALQKMIQAGTIPPPRFTLRLVCGAGDVRLRRVRGPPRRTIARPGHRRGQPRRRAVSRRMPVPPACMPRRPARRSSAIISSSSCMNSTGARRRRRSAASSSSARMAMTHAFRIRPSAFRRATLLDELQVLAQLSAGHVAH